MGLPLHALARLVAAEHLCAGSWACLHRCLRTDFMVNVKASSSLCTLFMAAKVIKSCFGFRLY